MPAFHSNEGTNGPGGHHLGQAPTILNAQCKTAWAASHRKPPLIVMARHDALRAVVDHCQNVLQGSHLRVSGFVVSQNDTLGT